MMRFLVVSARWAVLCAVVFALAAPAVAQNVPASVAASAAAAKPGVANTALKKVVLFSSGVGFFEHSGQVTDDAQVELKFKTQNINDLLKSMVVQDVGGQVSVVTYGSKDPISKTLKSFAIDLTTKPTMGQLLDQVRGEAVKVEAPNEITGTILGVETRDVKVGDKQVQKVEFLNLLTDTGLRSVALEQASSIKLVSDKLDSELRKALSLLASSHDMDKKSVTLSFVGEGKRDVRVGYIQETPIWKTSYRLVLEDEKAPLLQGWAIVENTTEEDWNEVTLSLVSGRPISFIMDLYQPLYIPRPTEELELYASLRPQSYEQDLAMKEKEFRRVAQQARADDADQLAESENARSGGQRALAAMAPMKKARESLDKAAPEPNAGFAFERKMKSAAAAGEVGEAFQYAIKTPVKLPRQQSAMLPIVNDEVKGEKVSIYNPSVQAKHPLMGLKMTNSTKLHLMQGPITVFDDGVYAGDAKIQDLPPGSERLISYAMDLNVEVAPENKGKPEELLSVRLAKGTMYVSRKYARSQEYTVKNSAKKVRKVLIEYPYDPQWTLVTPKEPAEKTRNMYRFLVEAKPGEPAKLVVDEERIEDQQVALTNLDDGSIRIYLSAKVVSEEVKAALGQVIKLKSELGQVQVKRQQLTAQIQVIEQEQNRIRQNMAQLDRNGDLYKRYVQKFTEQEDLNDKLRKEILGLTEQENAARKQLDDYLLNLDIK